MAGSGKEYQLAVKIAGKLDSSFNAAISQASSQMSALGSMGAAFGKSLKIAAGGFTATAAAVAGAGVASVKTGMEFDSAMSQVAATMGTTVTCVTLRKRWALPRHSAPRSLPRP